jgi:energy-coupling factor transporter ATP-binding protein EcfA2
VTDWQALETEVFGLFSPGAPIRLETELSGRQEQAARLRRIVISPGEHALIYGERGVGKTSIANSFHGGLNSATRQVQSVVVNCDGQSFSDTWRKVFRRLQIDGRPISERYTAEITPDDVEIELQNFSLNALPIIIIDEFDQASVGVRKLFTETIKSLSDHSVHAKIILVGIADNAGELIEDHQSISRALKQVEMPRLSIVELEKIVVSRYRQAALSFTDDALFLMAFLSKGLPYYMHLCGRYSALSAIRGKRKKVVVDDVISGLGEAIAEVDQTITQKYLSAVVSQRGEETLFEPVLLACALADADKLGQFQQSAVSKPLAELVSRTPPYTPTTFAFHMNEFCEQKRGAVLEKDGPQRNIRYKFADALMQPYVIIAALKEERMSLPTLRKFIPQRQKSVDFQSHVP